MRAVTFSQFGGPEVLEILDLPAPEPGPGQVRVRVAAATVNPTDISFRSGGRLPDGLEPPYIPGMDLAGVVDVIGEGSNWRPGARVMGVVNPRRPEGGAMAEYVVLPADSVMRIPEGTTLEEASTLPMNGLTVRLALDRLELKPESTLVVTGGAGAVGGYAIEVGVADGLRVIAVAATSDEPLLKKFGAEAVVARGDGAAQAIRCLVPEGADGLIDGAVIGTAVLPAIRHGGGLAAVRAFEGETERDISIHQIRVTDYAENQDALDGLRRLVEAEKLTLRVAEILPLERVGEAHQRLAVGGVRGRLVISF